MKIGLRTNTKQTLLAGILLVVVSGCQGGLTGIPSLSNLNNPSRVPPAPLGTFQIPANYTDPTGGGATSPRSPTLGQLRSIETGKPVGEKIVSDGFVASEVTNGSFTSKPVVAQAVSTLQSSGSQFNRSIEAASAAFSSNSKIDLPGSTTLSDASGPEMEDNEPTVVQAAALSELPDPRFNQASKASISSQDGVKWKSPR